ncbi:MAG: SCO7613 C-terminal domain-containing membrane protein [Mycobacteriales bacterium]
MSTPCPDCRAPLTGADRCPRCGLSLLGPDAARLWWVDQQLATLTAERIALLARLRNPLPTPTPATPVPATPVPVGVWSPPRESSATSAQNTLLGLGALLLAAAGLVFAAVTYSHLGVTGRAVVLVLLTLLAAAGATELSRRTLPASAEAVAAVAVVLSVVDAWAVRRAGLGSSMDAAAYAAVASGLLALLAGLWATGTALRVTQAAAVVLAQGAVVLELAGHHGPAARVATVLALLVAANAGAARLPLPPVVQWTAGAFGALWTSGVLVAAGVSYADAEPAGCIGLLVLAAVAAGLAAQQVQGAALAVPLLVAAAGWVASRPSLTDAQRPLVLAAVALVSLQLAALLKERKEAVLGSLAVAAAAVLVETPGVAEAVAGPLTWLADAWSFSGTRARDAVAVGISWDGTVVTVVVLAAAAGAALAAGVVLDRVRDALLPASCLLGLAAVALPLGLATGFRTAIVIQLALAAALCAGSAKIPALGPAGLGVATIATAWSLAQQDTTLAALPVAAVLAGAVAVRWGLLTGAALSLAGAELAAVAVAQDLHTDQVGAVLLLAVAVCVALSFVLRGLHGLGAEVAAALLGTVGLSLCTGDAGWLSWSLTVDGVLALAVAVRPDRRAVGYAGALLLSASSWVRLADANVHAPEPYVLPLAVMTLALGYLRRSHPGMGSFEAYGAGLALALVPSLLTSLDDPTPFRGLMLLLAAAAVLLVGSQQRLRAPLAIGGSVLAVDAVHLLAPYAAALPRWLVLAAAGALLVGVGATYEQRRRDVQRIRDRFDSFA